MLKVFIIALLVLNLPLFSNTAWGRTVIDEKNIAVEIPDQVNRLVSIPIPMASMIITIDQSTRRLVGINRASHNDFVEGFLPKIYPEVATIPYDIAADGFVPNVETLANLHPDVVIQWGDMGEHLIKPLKEAGFPVVTTIYGETIYVADWMRIIGHILNKSQRANYLADLFEKDYQQLKAENQYPAEARPRVIYLSRYASGLVVAGKNNSFQGDIELAGGSNAASEVQGITPVSVEQLVVWDPQIILLSTFEANLTPDTLYHDARLQAISAIKNKRVYSYPRGGFRWDPPSHESILALKWLSFLFHPEQITKRDSGQDFRQQMKQSYQLLYNYQLNDADIDSILRLADNQHSEYYCQLFCQPTAAEHK